jgi:hypothetical protein
MVGVVDFSIERLFDEFDGVDCRAERTTKLLERFFHRHRQVRPPADGLAHRFFGGAQHLLDCNVAVGARHGAVASLLRDGRRQFCLVGVHHEDYEQLGRLCLAGIGADIVVVAWKFGEALSGRAGRHRSVVDLAADRVLAAARRRGAAGPRN